MPQNFIDSRCAQGFLLPPDVRDWLPADHLAWFVIDAVRAMESHCRQDVAYRVITGNVVPDHATVARFVVRHESALAGLFGEVLRLCDQAGLVKPGLVAIDGTRLAGNASREANREFEQIAREMLAEHKATDEAEDQQYGEARGDELPEQLRTPEGRREFFRQTQARRPESRRPGTAARRERANGR